MITPTKSVTTKWVDMPQAVACYAPAYIYALEKQWFKHSQSFGLMQQAAWRRNKLALLISKHHHGAIEHIHHANQLPFKGLGRGLACQLGQQIIRGGHRH